MVFASIVKYYVDISKIGYPHSKLIEPTAKNNQHKHKQRERLSRRMNLSSFKNQPFYMLIIFALFFAD
jgi:hypothetical protein